LVEDISAWWLVSITRQCDKGEVVLLDLEEGILIVGGGHHPDSGEETIRINSDALQFCITLRWGEKEMKPGVSKYFISEGCDIEGSRG
jgi:hypothetical protein